MTAQPSARLRAVDLRAGRAWLLPALVGLVVAALFGTVSLGLHANGRTGMDLAIFDQAVRHLSRFELPVSSMKSPGMNLWGDHFHPLLVLAAPAYWLWDDPGTLLLVQAACLGLGAALLAHEARRLLEGRTGIGRGTALLAGLAVGCSFAANPGVQYAAVFDFHEVALGVPVLAMACRSLLRRQPRAFLVWSCLLLAVKEDTGLVVLGLALSAVVMGLRRMGSLVGVLAVAWSVLVLKVVLPALSPTGAWLYATAVPGIGGQLHNAASAFFGSGGLSRVLLVLLGSGLFLALGSPLVLALLPTLGSRAVTGNPAYEVLFNHYNLLPCVVLGFAMVHGLAHLRRRPGLLRAACWLLLVLALVNVWLGPARSQYADRMPEPRRQARAQLLALVPVGASVAADPYLTPHLTHDHPITQQVRPIRTEQGVRFLDDLGRPLVARYRLLDRQSHANGDDPVWVGQALEQFRAQSCRPLAEREGFVLLDCGA
ncbi:DUF2079 domain-containing protein [Luteococcus peritonei]|uniref:DUF2079 domain-containing protein n=1 Tax=Luteococcus peritonei TaxID=88874 RepID=A0ABW4RT72_9ACTN